MKKTVYTLQILLVLLALSLTRVFATQYFVDNQKGNDLNPGTSINAAWKSFEPVHAKELKPGDIVNFVSGSEWKTELTIDNSGTKENPIIFRAYGKGNKPVISNHAPARYGINITGKWIIVDGFMVKDPFYACIYIAKGAEHNIVQNCEMTNAGMGIGCYGKYNLFTHNFVHDLTMVKNTPRDVNNNDDYGAVAFWMFAPCNEISYNKAINCTAPSYDYGHDGGFFEIFGNGDSSYVHHNWGENCNGFHESGGGSSRGVIIAYNVSIGNEDLICLHLGKGFHQIVENMRIENNTIIELKGTQWNSVLDWAGGTPTPSTLSFRNNILVLGGEAADRVSKNGNFLHENNIYYLLGGAEVGFTLGNKEIVADPMFIDLKGKDFRLAKKSPANGTGINLGYKVDLNGKKLNAGKSPNIGAY